MQGECEAYGSDNRHKEYRAAIRGSYSARSEPQGNGYPKKDPHSRFQAHGGVSPALTAFANSSMHRRRILLLHIPKKTI